MFDTISAMFKPYFPELDEIESVIEHLGQAARVSTLTKVPVKKSGKELEFPLYAVSLGSQDPKAPVFAVFGGVHGLERIGTQVVTSYLKTIAQLVKWDSVTLSVLEKVRLIFIPLINPGGMYLESRSNPNGVDLMRNAPVEGELKSKYQLYAGHRFSTMLPWYRGKEGAPMEKEAKAVCDFIEANFFPSDLAVSVDVHSGFGSVDRLWFPYAKTNTPFPLAPEMLALKELLDSTYSNHIYEVEPQSKQYLTHGDLWDYLYDKYKEGKPNGIYLPLCLELGSWLWVKKNPSQLFSSLGVFNPIEKHRYQRILRRHLVLMDFLLKATVSPKVWASLTPEERKEIEIRAHALWYKTT